QTGPIAPGRHLRWRLELGREIPRKIHFPVGGQIYQSALAMEQENHLLPRQQACLIRLDGMPYGPSTLLHRENRIVCVVGLSDRPHFATASWHDLDYRAREWRSRG